MLLAKTNNKYANTTAMLITNNWHYLFTITGLIFHNSFKEGDCVRLDLCKAVFLV